MKNIILLLATVIILCNVNDVKASDLQLNNNFQLNKINSFHSSVDLDEENDGNSINNEKISSSQLNEINSFHSNIDTSEDDDVSSTDNNIDIENRVRKILCRVIWNDNLFYQNKSEIFNRINSEDKYLSSFYISEILIRMLSDEQFRQNILKDKQFDEIKEELCNYMKYRFVDDYLTYCHYTKGYPEIHEEDIEDRKNCKKWLLNSIYDLGYDGVQDFEEYVKRCIDLYRDINFI